VLEQEGDARSVGRRPINGGRSGSEHCGIEDWHLAGTARLERRPPSILLAQPLQFPVPDLEETVQLRRSWREQRNVRAAVLRGQVYEPAFWGRSNSAMKRQIPWQRRVFSAKQRGDCP